MGCGANSKLFQNKDEGPPVEPYYEPVPATQSATGDVQQTTPTAANHAEEGKEPEDQNPSVQHDPSFFTREAAHRGAMMD